MEKFINAVNSINHAVLVFFLILLVLGLFVCLRITSLEVTLDKLTTAFLAIMTVKNMVKTKNSAS